VLAGSHQPDQSKQVQVLIALNDHATSLTIVRDGVVRLSQSINIGAQAFDRAIATSLNLHRPDIVARSHQLACATSFQSDADDEHASMVGRAVRRAVRPQIVALARHVKLCLRQDRVDTPGTPPDSATVLGERANQPWLINMLSRETGLTLHAAA